MIIRGGLTVYLREVEELLYEHPAICEAAAVGVPYDEGDEEVGAAVVFEPGAEASSEEIAPWGARADRRLQVPRVVWLLEGLPKGPKGKVLKPARSRGRAVAPAYPAAPERSEPTTRSTSVST
jgi:long-chain acyl-CoA synthetase